MDIEQKLKALKVADLKAVLTTADVQVPAKATKADLITRILASQEAQDAYKSLYEPETAAEQDESVEKKEAEAPAAEGEPKEPAPESTEPAKAPEEPAPEAAAEPVDPELEKRKARAARFGIPLVEPPAKPAPKAKKGPAARQGHDDPEKLKARAARFGTANKAEEPSSRKRPAAASEAVDPEEAERRRKRAERFGMKPTTT